MKIFIKNLTLIITSVFLVMFSNNIYALANDGDDGFISISPEEIMKLYKEDEPKANEIFKDKTVKINGTVDGVSKNLYQIKINIKTLNNELIVCEVSSSDKKLSNINAGDDVSIEGVCKGKLGNNVYVTQCVIK